MAWAAAADHAGSILAGILGSPPGLHLTSSCTHAIEAAATVLDIGPGDEVVVPAYSFPSTANPFVLRGASLRFADADLRTGNLTVGEVRRCTTDRTRAVVAMHYGGVACDVDAIGEHCRSRGISFIEDAAHSLFASSGGTPLGRFGDFAALSFHRTKNVSSFDGGALVVNDPAHAGVVAAALDKGTNRRAFERGEVAAYEWVAPGSAWRLSEPLAALLDDALRHADAQQRRRHAIWSRYREALRPWASTAGVGLAEVPDGCAHSAHIFWALLPGGWDRSEFVEHCAARGVEVARHFGSLPDSTFGRSVAHPDDRCPNALALADRLIRLPLHHDLTDDEVDRAVDAVTTWPGRAP